MDIVKPIIPDIPRLLLLWQAQYTFHHNLDPDYYVNNSKELDEKFKEYLTIAIEKDTPRILVAKEGDRMVGFITFEESSEEYLDNKTKEFGVVIELYVLEDMRGKGVGQTLLTAAEAFFRSKELHQVKLQCSMYGKNALEFYDHLGYKNKQAVLFKRI